MSDPKPIASLSPTLLARKGGAKPAMRNQWQNAQAMREATAPRLDDLGFNDFGEGDVHSAGGEVVELVPGSLSEAASIPEVVRQQRDLGKRAAKPRRSALADGRNAAFTLRLDAKRHLDLRLACTISNRSAQQIVTEALDRLLGDMPELANLSAQARKLR